MDTAQRGMGGDRATALEVFQRTMRAGTDHTMRPRAACGAGTDHVALFDRTSADAIAAACEAEAEAIAAAGGQAAS